MLAMMIGGMCASVQAELDGLFAQIDGQPVRTRGVSAQAFSKARMGFSWTVFTQANERLLGLAQPLIDAHRWNGLRVVAADGSRLQVSTRAGAHLGAHHYAFALFLPGAELTLHASLQPADGSERQMLFEALDAVQPDNDLLVLDRGLPGNTMAAILSQSRRHFCMRVDATGWKSVRQFLRSGHRETLVTLHAPSTPDARIYEIDRAPTRVRLIRDVTPTGNVRVLMTSLLDAERYPAAQFGALYHQRWRIEEAFKRIKHRLRLEAATGLTYLAFQQDFAAKILADNLQRVLTAPALPNDETTSTKRTNRTYAIGALKPILAGCLLQLAYCLSALPAALAASARVICRVKRGRTYPRPPRTKPHLHLAYKSAC
jgi:hypothetical protein